LRWPRSRRADQGPLRHDRARPSAAGDIGDGKSLVSSITSHSATALELAPGKQACALFDAAHVIIAID
jgi:molybdopterin-binding protein